MTNIQAFTLAFVVLTIQTVTLIVFGCMFDGEGVGATSILFLAVDLSLCAVASDLKIIKEK
jgi:hypothetical protein